LPSNKLHIEKALNMILEQGKKRIGILGFSFKANTDDLRESPMVEIIERLLGKGYDLTLFDASVNQAKLHGANREYIMNHIPHISNIMVSSVAEVLSWSEVIVVGNKSKEFSEISDLIREDQILIDFVRIKEKPSHVKHYHGICW
jgi:GDP-mannose 6-dehydrogenase